MKLVIWKRKVKTKEANMWDKFFGKTWISFLVYIDRIHLILVKSKFNALRSVPDTKIFSFYQIIYFYFAYRYRLFFAQQMKTETRLTPSLRIELIKC